MRANKPSATSPKTIDEYLARLPTDQRAALMKLRRTIRAAAPGMTESISHHMPTFKLDGRPIVYFAAAKAHLAVYGTSKGTIRFTPDEPLPAALVTRLVKERIAKVKSRHRYGR